MRRRPALLLLLGLSACGDDGPQVRVNRRPADASGSPSSKPPPGDLDRLRAGNERAQALARRPLTAADVETYVAMTSAWRAAANDLALQEAALDLHGLALQEWRVLYGRMAPLVSLLERGVPDTKLAADLETVRPFLERIQAAKQGK